MRLQMVTLSPESQDWAALAAGVQGGRRIRKWVGGGWGQEGKNRALCLFVPFGVSQTSSWPTVTQMEMLRAQYLVLPNEPKGGFLIAAVVPTAHQRQLFLHPGLHL